MLCAALQRAAVRQLDAVLLLAVQVANVLLLRASDVCALVCLVCYCAAVEACLFVSWMPMFTLFI